jgi:hypothetical protein
VLGSAKNAYFCLFRIEVKQQKAENKNEPFVHKPVCQHAKVFFYRFQTKTKNAKRN